MIESITSFGTATFGGWWPLIWTLVRAVCIILPLLLCVAYLILWERRSVCHDPPECASKPLLAQVLARRRSIRTSA